MQEKLSLNCFNCRGLGDGRKRRAVFQWLRKYFKGIVLLQETHSSRLSEKQWQNDWGGEIYFSHGTSSARGVATLIPKQFDIRINNLIADDTGRFLLLDASTDDWEMVICNVYAPTKDKETEQINFITNISELLEDFLDKNIVIGGDFNTCMDPLKDKSGGTIEKKSKYAQHLETLCERFNLGDVWRILNPDISRFTRRANTRGGIIQSRLDYWFTSIHMLYDLDSTDIKPAIKSDHSILTLIFNIKNTHIKGKGFWKFNASLLRDQEYVKRIKTCITESKEKYKNLQNKSLVWDTTKCEIRTITISYACHKAKEKRLIERETIKRLERLDLLINQGETLYLDEYHSLQKDLEDLHLEQAKGIMIRSRAEIVDNDEKNSKYFLNLEKRNYRLRYIKTLKTNDDKELTDPQLILKEEESFYKNLYSKPRSTPEHELKECEFIQYCKQIDENGKKLCDKDITVEELGKNLKNLPNNKSPGCDGLTTDFYKFFWVDIKFILLESLLYSLETGYLSIEQRRAVLSLIPKLNKDLRYLKNWRPLSLLNTDYKILAKSLGTRLQSVIAQIVSIDQSAYIKGRFIGENIRTIVDVLNFSQLYDIPGLMIFLDFEKAFDSISWEFLFKILEESNFGENFIRWIRILYNDPLLCVMNNGFASSFFPTNRGIRQGCPISALLFLLVVEVLAEKIKNSPQISGINIRGTDFVISQLADDTTLFLKDTLSLSHVLTVLSHFEICAGLKLNRGKSEAIMLGHAVKSPSSVCGIKIVDKPIKTLGVWISKDTASISNINFEERLSKLRALLNMWKQRQLSLKGKITIINSLALSQILYVASVLYVPQEVIKEVNQLIFSFLWPKKVHVKRTTVIGPIEEGGLKMPDFEIKVRACKAMWIKRLLSNPKCSVLAESFGLPFTLREMCLFNFDMKFLETYNSAFYKQVLNSWYELRNVQCKTASDVRKQVLWYNKEILIENKPAVYRTLYVNGIVYINDILDNTGNFLELDILSRKFNVNLTIMKYNSLKDAIPKTWRNLVKQSHTIDILPVIVICINNVRKSLTNVCNRDIYWELVTRIVEQPTSLYKWEECYYWYDFDWNDIFCNSFKVVRESYIQSLQYRILNRFFPCNENLKKWNCSNSNLCEICQENDSIEHYFYECNDVQLFWTSFNNWWRNMTSVHFRLCITDVLFGVRNPNNLPLLDALNFCILFAKTFIYEQRKNRKELLLYYFQVELKKRLDIEYCLCTQQNSVVKFCTQWSDIYDNL